ncbi:MULTISPECIES: phage tail assembly chaperone [Bradyrhizobium]|uniref:Phage tail assembly chaperone n=1 Tax=Bradyrhizobium barranii subsp. barranii TaxID=2823807 RepID=A0A939M7J3_9BRAD|nr:MULTISPECIES: phage tail assembly chaperone [Bradyrhizobium]MCD9819801.1 phage tail assembly chaperone [Bradyrhizobium japonicum]MEB2675155.1 phage tail assembly chaperone [Bradyrhizobium japonicum]UEM08244.1 phage tail assembly chaperone [Bradyrhizobium barranii subsp. barranii]WLB25028.1 phage tail assembly chaperone [Bradyrhizobium japonicum]WRI85532.1 phage tail assembly chaperone [Bradyrhizobium japonicum]
MNIHYSVTTGQIMVVGFGPVDDQDGADSHLDGCKVLIVDDGQAVDARRDRVDPITRTVVLKDAPDAPDTLADVRRAVAAELAGTDRFVLPDFPISETERAAWISYRKELRDSSKGRATPADMLSAVPVRPDDVDAFEWLRSRLSAPGV